MFRMEANASFLPVGAVFTHARFHLRADTALPVGAVFNRADSPLRTVTAPIGFKLRPSQRLIVYH